jgi:hypothetical protein
LENKASLCGVRDTFVVTHISLTWRISLHVWEHKNTSSSPLAFPLASVISIPEFTSLW